MLMSTISFLKFSSGFQKRHSLLRDQMKTIDVPRSIGTIDKIAVCNKIFQLFGFTLDMIRSDEIQDSRINPPPNESTYQHVADSGHSSSTPPSVLSFA